MQLCAAQIVCLCLGIVTGGLLHKLGVTGFKQDESFGSILVGTLSFQGAAWLLIPFFLRKHQVGWRAAFGFCGPRLNRALLTAFGFTVVVLPVVLLLQGGSVHVLEKLGWPSEDQAAVKLLTNAQSVGTTVYLGVFAVVLAPVAEEFIFRGMLFPFIKQFRSPELVAFPAMQTAKTRLVLQTTRLAGARVVRREFCVRADSSERADVRAAVRFRARADVALRPD